MGSDVAGRRHGQGEDDEAKFVVDETAAIDVGVEELGDDVAARILTTVGG